MLKSVKIFFTVIGKGYISSMKTILIIIGLLLVQTINTQDLNKSHAEKDSCEKIETTEIISGSVIILSFIKGNQSSNTNDKPDFLRTGRNGSRKGKNKDMSKLAKMLRAWFKSIKSIIIKKINIF